MLALDEGRRLDQIFPCRRAVRHPDLGPNGLQVVAGIGDVVVAEAEPLARHRVVGAALTQVEQRSVLPLGFLDHVGHVEHLRLERARGREELEQVVPLLRGDLGVGPRAEIGERDVVDRDFDTFGGSPVLRVLVEPDVVGGDEMAPLEDLEGFSRRLIRIVGPRARAAAAPAVVVTNSRRSICFRFAMDLASVGSKKGCQVSGAGCQVRNT